MHLFSDRYVLIRNLKLQSRGNNMLIIVADFMIAKNDYCTYYKTIGVFTVYAFVIYCNLEVMNLLELFADTSLGPQAGEVNANWR